MNNIMMLQNQTIRDVILTNKLQIFEVKQIAELEDFYKKYCKKTLSDYRKWKIFHAQELDVVELLYGQLKGIILRRNAQNAVQAYWIIRKDFKVVFQKYLSETKSYKKTA